MRSGVAEWLATCIGSPICILLLSWSLLIYQHQPAATKRRVDVLTVAILGQSLLHQLGLLLFAILTLVHPANHFGEFCSGLVWLINSTSILQELSLTTIAVFAALTARDEGPNIKKHHLKYHLSSLTVISACIGVTGVLNFEPEGCVFLAHDISPKYGLYFNGLRSALALVTLFSLLGALFRGTCRRSPKAELLKSVSDLSEASSKNSGSFECQHHQQQLQQQHLQLQHSQWEPSSGSCTSGSTNSRACLKKRSSPEVDEASQWPTIYTILFVCYAFDHLPLLIVSMRPDILRGLCTPLNLATWLPLLQDTLLPVSLAIFDRKFCQYVAKVYTKQDHTTRITHGGVDGKFRTFEQDNEYKLQLNLNHGLKFPMSEGPNGGNLYGRLQNHQNRGRNGTMLLGIHQYGRGNLSSGENTYASIAPDSYLSSNLDSHRQQQQVQQQHQQQQQPQQQQQQQQLQQLQFDSKSPKMQSPRHQHQPVTRNLSRANSTSNGTCKGTYGANQQQQQQQPQPEFCLGPRCKMTNTDIFGQKFENLMQLDEQSYVQQQYNGAARRLRNFAKSLDEIREEAPRRNSRSVMANHPDLELQLQQQQQQQQQHPLGFRQQQFALNHHHHHLQQQQQKQQQQQRAAAALRRNQSFDLHANRPGLFPRLELPLMSSSTYDVKREIAFKRGFMLVEQLPPSGIRRPGTALEQHEYEEEEEAAGYETSDDESCDRESQDFDTMSSCHSRAHSCCSVTTVANDDFEFFQRKGTKELQSPVHQSRPLESKGSMRCFTPRIIEPKNQQQQRDQNKKRKDDKGDVQEDPCKPVIQSYRLKKKITPGYSLNDLDKFHATSGSSGSGTANYSKPPTLSVESLKSILRSSDVSYLDNGEVCRHDLGGSAPDFKRIFVTEFI